MSGQVLPFQGAFQRSGDIAAQKKAQAELAEIQRREDEKALSAKRQQAVCETDPSLAGVAKLNIAGMSAAEVDAALSQSLEDFTTLCELRNQPLNDADAVLLSQYCIRNGLDVFSPWVLQTAYDTLVQRGVLSKPLPKPVEKPAVKAEPTAEDKAQTDANALAFLNSNRTDELADPERRAVVDEWVRETFGVAAREFFKNAAETRNFSLSKSGFEQLRSFMQSRNQNFADPAHLDKACRALFPTEYLLPIEKRRLELDRRMEKLSTRNPNYYEEWRQLRTEYARLDREAK